MPGIPRRLAGHSLNILKGFKPVKQTLRRFSEPKRQAMGEELAKLLEAGFIREIKHPDWLANLVMVPKKDKPGAYVSISRTLTRLAPRIPSPSPASIKLSTLPQDMIHCVSSTHTPDTIKSRWRSPIKPQRHLSLHTAPSVLTPCLSGLKTPVQPINA